MAIDAENLGLLFQSEQWCQLEPRFSLGSKLFGSCEPGPPLSLLQDLGPKNARDLLSGFPGGVGQ